MRGVLSPWLDYLDEVKVEIEIRSKKHGVVKTLIDDEDFHLIQGLKLYVCLEANKSGGNFRVRVYVGGKNEYLHRFIMGVCGNKLLMVDHKYGNTLDNRRSNLRLCGTAENQHNRKKSNQASTSIYKGVRWHKRDKRWIAQTKLNGKDIHIGSFLNEKDAAIAYNEKAIELFGEFALLNDV